MDHQPLSPKTITDLLEQQLPEWLGAGERILAIIPDRTRSAPIPVVFSALNQISKRSGCTIDYLIALGTHPPLDDHEV